MVNKSRNKEADQKLLFGRPLLLCAVASRLFKVSLNRIKKIKCLEIEFHHRLNAVVVYPVGLRS